MWLLVSKLLKELHLFPLIPDCKIFILLLQNYSAQMILISLFSKFDMKFMWIFRICVLNSFGSQFKMFDFFGKLLILGVFFSQSSKSFVFVY